MSYNILLKQLLNFKLEYKLYILFSSYKLIYYYNNYEIKIIYDNYPIKNPSNIFINNKNIFGIYKNITKEYYLNKWDSKFNINEIHDYIIRFIKFNTESIMLRMVINKFSNESMDYLYSYLF